MPANDSWTAQRDAFLQSPPPRQVPPIILNAVAPAQGHGYALIMCALLFSFGALLCWLFLPPHLLQEWKLKLGKSENVSGRILTREIISAPRSTYEYTYLYATTDLTLKNGTAYSSKRWREGDIVRLNYSSADPSLALPENARLDKQSRINCLLLLLPLCGIIAACAHIHYYRQRRYLLIHGIVSTGQITHIMELPPADSKATVPPAPFYQITFALAASHPELQQKTDDPAAVKLMVEKLHAQQPLIILHASDNPKKFLLPELWKPRGY